MKRTRLVKKLLLAVGITALAVAGAQAADSKDMRVSRGAAAAQRDRVVLVQVTGSWIPQRVVISGDAVNSASPVTFYGRNDLLRSGASDVGAVLASVDPSISIRRR